MSSLSIMSLLVCLVSSTADIDRKLDTSTISLKCDNTSYSDLCKVLEKQTGVFFAPSPELADRKIIAYCGPLSTRSFMKAAEETLGIKWVVKDLQVDVKVDPNRKVEESNDSMRRTNKVYSRLNASLEYLAWYANLTEPERKKVQDGTLNTKTTLEVAAQKALQKETKMQWVALSLKQNYNAFIQSVSKGTEYVFSSKEGEGFVSLDPSFSALYQQAYGRMRGPVRFIVGFNPYSFKIRLWDLVADSADSTDMDVTVLPSTVDMQVPSIQQVASDLTKSETEEIAAARSELTASLPANRTPVASQYLANCYSLSDHLGALYEWTKKPFIAEGSRFAVSGPQFCSGSTIGSYLDELSKASRSEKPHDRFAPIRKYRQVGEWTTVTLDNLPSLRQRDVPERLLKPIETRFIANQFLTTPDYYTLVTKLNRIQESCFDPDATIYLCRFPLNPLRLHRPILRFLAALEMNTLRETMTRHVDVRTLPLVQQQALANAMVSLVKANALSSDEFLTLYRLDFRSLYRLTFHYYEGRMAMPHYDPEPYGGGDPPMQARPFPYYTLVKFEFKLGLSKQLFTSYILETPASRLPK